MSIPHASIHATHSKLTIGLSQPDLKYVKCTTVVTTADASSPMDSNLNYLLSLHVDFHQISHSLFSKLAFLDPLRQTDFFGPFASNNSTTYSKRFGLIFTCMTTGAVHLEMGHDLSSDANLTALRRFFARRGTPSEIRSDNATNFTAAEKELMTTFDSSSMNQFFEYHQISWTFNPAYAPHFGGV